MFTSTRYFYVLLFFSLFSLSGAGFCFAEDISVENFDAMTPAELTQMVSVSGDNLGLSLIKTDERAGIQNLLLTATLDPANPNWNHIRIKFPRRIDNPDTLTFWYRGDKVSRLYLILEDSEGTRTDCTIGGDMAASQWIQAIIQLQDMHMPQGTPPNDKATLKDVVALEVFPYPQAFPSKGEYKFQIDDISLIRSETVDSYTVLDELIAPVKNGDFEQVNADGNGFPEWSFTISRDAKVSMSASHEIKHSGNTAVLFENKSSIANHVYGRFLQRVPVQPSTPYKISCWVKGKSVGMGSHWTDWIVYTLNIPSGDFDWQKIEGTFTTKPDQTALELGFNCVNTTEKLWIDDIQISTDLEMVQSSIIPGGKIAIWTPESIVTDKEEGTTKVYWQDFPNVKGKMHIEVVQDEKVLGNLEREWNGQRGFVLSRLPLIKNEEKEAKVVVSLLDEKGNVLVKATRDITLYSSTYARVELDKVRAQFDLFMIAFKDWQASGLPIDYPNVTKTVAEHFIPWIEEDINYGEVKRALQQIDELHTILASAIAQCQHLPLASSITAPRYKTGKIEIDGGHFVADTLWPNGKAERRPVFFNGYGHFNTVQRDMPILPDYGLNIMQREMGPSSTVMENMTIDLAYARDFAKIMDAAGKANVAFNLLLSPHYFPEWALQKWPELRGVSGGFNSFDIDNPHAREVEEAFLRAVIKEFKGKAALHSFCLSNEPIYVDPSASKINTAKWHEWLQKHHGSIEKLNKIYGTKYSSFDEVPSESSNLDPRPQLYDWVSFNNERFAAWHKWMADIIHEIDPTIPVHAKIMNLPFWRATVGWGNDVELFCDLSQIAGNDNSNNYIHDESELWADSWQGANQYMDLLRSMRGQPSFNSENHVVADRNWLPVPGMHIRNLIWQGAVHGQGASTMWVWERTFDNKSDFAGSIMHRPAFCDAHGRTALDLMRLAPQVVQLQEQPARVAILYSICSQVWNMQYSTAVGQIYQALTFMGEKIDFITYRQLINGEGEKYKVIIAPQVTHLEQAAYPALEKFAQNAGHVLATFGDNCLAFDEYNQARDISKLPVKALPEVDSKKLRNEMLHLLKLDYPVQVVDAQTGELNWGAGWRWADDGQRWLVNICNYTRKPMTLQVKTEGGWQGTNLFTGQLAGKTFTLQPMEPIIISIPK